MNRCEQLEFDIEEMKDQVSIQLCELVTMQYELKSLELKIEHLVNNNGN